MKQENGDLIISLGTDDGAELVRGAYVVTPDGKRGYYPKHSYTIGAQEAYEKGVAIKPIAGWNYYMLKRE